MLIGKAGSAKTAIAAASPDRIHVRGRDLASDLMGRATFTQFVYLLATGKAPTDDQLFAFDLALVAIAEHGLTPSVQAARMTLAADPAALQGAVAAGVLGCGTVILGAADLCRALIDDVLGRMGAEGRSKPRRFPPRASAARRESPFPATATRCTSPSIRAPHA